MSTAVFLLLAALTLTAALTVILHPNPVHSALGLVTTLFLLSVFFIALDAQLIGVLQIIVYAGAIVVLFLFVIMLLNLQAEPRMIGAGPLVLTALAGGLALAALLITGLRGGATPPSAGVATTFGDTASVAERLFTVYLLPFELTSLLLLVAVIGAVAIAKRRG